MPSFVTLGFYMRVTIVEKAQRIQSGLVPTIKFISGNLLQGLIRDFQRVLTCYFLSRIYPNHRVATNDFPNLISSTRI